MSGTEITIALGGGESFMGYLAEPASKRGPGILLLQEIFGVNDVMRGLAEGFAAQGYFALVPDLFWRQAPGIQLSDKTEAEWKRAFELYQGFDVDQGVADAKAALAHLRTLRGASGKAGTVGYCLGGKLAYLMAARSDAECSVAYYGVGLDELLNEAAAITRPLLLHIAGKDQFVPPQAQAKIHAALDGHPCVTLHDYAHADHAFARTDGITYDEAAATLAHRRTGDFFRHHLE